MTRSGTSLTMRTLNLLGVDLGPEGELLPGPDPSNPKGFWEQDKLKRLNNTILRSMGGRVHEPPPLPIGWQGAPALDELKARARDLMQERFAGSPLWGWKDPRNCLTLPFWQELLPEMSYVVCIRNPLDVAASLAKRGGLSIEKSLGLWQRYVASSIAHTAGGDRIFVFFEDFFDDWELQLARLAHFIGAAERSAEPAIRQVVEEWVAQDLWHHRTSVPSTIGDPQVPPDPKALYLLLQAAVRPAGMDGDSNVPVGSVEDSLNDLARRLAGLEAEPASMAETP
jgi:hypothetical protein